MALDQSNFRSILAQILSVDQKYIVPKQGNWFNPQDVLIGGAKPDNWAAFKINQGRPLIVPMMQPTDDTGLVQASVTWFKGWAEIQFLGVNAEDLAQSVPHWVHREDVKALFSSIGAELMACDTGYKTDSYYQDGLNTVLAYRVTINILHSNGVEAHQALWSAVVPGHSMFI